MDIVNNFDLQLFAEGAAAPGSAAAGTGEGGAGDASATSDTAVTKTKRKAKTDPFANVIFGKQAVDPETDTADNTNAEEKAEGDISKGDSSTASGPPSLAREGDTDGEDGIDKPKTYTEAEYKKGIEEAVKRRFKNNANEKKAMEPILRYVSETLGVDIDDIEGLAKASDTARNQHYEDEAGRTGNDIEVIRKNADNAYNVRNYRQELDSIKRASEADAFNKRMEAQESALREIYPEFDFGKEIENPKFRNLIKAGFEMQNAYESVHYKELVEKARADALKKATDAVTASVAAGANRPSEGGVTNPSAQVIADPKLMTKEQRAEVKKRVRRGEKIIW